MKRLNQGVFWGIFLILGGLFLLLKNLDVLGPWGEIAWAGLFTVVGVAFLFAFLSNLRHWWWAIAAFTLFSLGVPLLLAQWTTFDLGPWQSSVVLFGVALGFWVVLLVSPDNWWAEIPAGVLTLLGVMLGLQGALRDPQQWLAVFTIGLGLVFALLYVIRARESGGWWPAVPAVGLILFGVIALIGQAAPGMLAARWWPLAMIAVGLVVLVLALQRVPARKPAAFPDKAELEPASYDMPRPAEGASITEVVPYVEMPTARPKESPAQPEAAPAAPAEEKPAPGGDIDIYEFLKNQPPETPGSGG